MAQGIQFLGNAVTRQPATQPFRNIALHIAAADAGNGNREEGTQVIVHDTLGSLVGSRGEAMLLVFQVAVRDFFERFLARWKKAEDPRLLHPNDLRASCSPRFRQGASAGQFSEAAPARNVLP